MMAGRISFNMVFSFVIARNETTKQSILSLWPMDCLPSLAMTVGR
jgi:hypothetical protein